MTGSYYEGLELLEYCNAIDFVDLIDHEYLVEKPNNDENAGDDSLIHNSQPNGRKRSNSFSSVSSDYELPPLDSSAINSTTTPNRGYVENIIKKPAESETSSNTNNTNNNNSNTTNKSSSNHSSRYKKSKKNMELQNQAILNNPFLQHTFISSDNFSSNKEVINNFTNTLISRVFLNGIKSISLNNLKSFNSTNFAAMAKSGSAANNLAEIALAVYNERYQVEDLQKHELRQRELLRIREQEVQKAKAAHEAEARNKARLQLEADNKKREMEASTANANISPATGSKAPNKSDQKKFKANASIPLSDKKAANATNKSDDFTGEFTVEDFTIALKSLLKNKDLKLPDLSPQQVDIIARSPTFQNNKVIIDLIRTTIKAKKAMEANSQISVHDDEQKSEVLADSAKDMNQDDKPSSDDFKRNKDLQTNDNHEIIINEGSTAIPENKKISVDSQAPVSENLGETNFTAKDVLDISSETANIAQNSVENVSDAKDSTEGDSINVSKGIIMGVSNENDTHPTSNGIIKEKSVQHGEPTGSEKEPLKHEKVPEIVEKGLVQILKKENSNKNISYDTEEKLGKSVDSNGAAHSMKNSIAETDRKSKSNSPEKTSENYVGQESPAISGDPLSETADIGKTSEKAEMTRADVAGSVDAPAL